MTKNLEKINNQAEITRIRPSGLGLNLELKQLWAYRELLYFLTLRDVKVRYKQTAIGILWAILQPVLTTVIFTIIFTQFARFDSLNIPYPLFALSGLLIWLFVNTSITLASNSIVGNSNLVTKIYFPRLIVPIAATFAGLPDFALGLIILAITMLYYGVNFTWQIIFAPLFVVLAILLATSFGILFSAVNVRFRDVKFALPFALQLWIFISPVFYPLNSLAEKWHIWFSFNPLTGILEGFRASLFGMEFDWVCIGISVFLTIFLMFIALFVFKKMEDDFADLI